MTELSLGRGAARRGSLGHVSCDFLFQTLAEAVVEEEELAVRKQAAEQRVHAVALQQDLEGKRGQ